jgi:hypothetical protein
MLVRQLTQQQLINPTEASPLEEKLPGDGIIHILVLTIWVLCVSATPNSQAWFPRCWLDRNFANCQPVPIRRETMVAWTVSLHNADGPTGKTAQAWVWCCTQGRICSQRTSLGDDWGTTPGLDRHRSSRAVETSRLNSAPHRNPLDRARKIHQ